ncbi:MAG: hypothetical protein Q9165_001451 [Trypethelium subeluteriae]
MIAYLHLTSALLAFTAYASVIDSGTLVKRSDTYDIYLFDEQDCQQFESGHLCEGYEGEICCYVPVATGGRPTLMSSANYHYAGQPNPTDDHEIQVFSSGTTDHCINQVSKDPKCANGLYGAVSGAYVYDGGKTPTKDKKRSTTPAGNSTSVSKPALKVFYKVGDKVWTLPADSELGKQFSNMNDTSQKGQFMQQHGTVKFQ